MSIPSNEWTWISGSNTVPQSYQGQSGVYGTLGIPSTSNTPGARSNGVSWIDSSGNLWLFGGVGYYSGGSGGQLNDLWEFNPNAETWTWVSGANVETANGVYGTLGKASVNNVPGGRSGAGSWIDSSGNLWLFGGDGTASSTSGYLNDLWKFNPADEEWAWMSGSSSPNVSGV